MRRILALSVLVATSCATSRTAAPDPDVPTAACALPIARAPLTAARIAAVRIGVEYLPPAAETAPSLAPAVPAWSTNPLPQPAGLADPTTPLAIARPAIRVRSLRSPARLDVELPIDKPSLQLETPWTLDVEQLEDITNPAERFTMRFMTDLVGEDRRRMRRELAAPVLTTRMWHLTTPQLVNHLDERDEEEEASYMTQIARRLLRRPLRKALRHGTFVSDLEELVERFKSRNVPLSGNYQQHHPDRGSLGRVSVRLRPSRLEDPLEVSYINWGWRVGSGQRRFRLDYGVQLTEDIHAGFRARMMYETGDTSLRADLRYRIDENTELSMIAGDRLVFLGGPTEFSFLQSPMDGDHGLLFYVEHYF